MSNSSSHLKALLKKNWILFKRNYFGSLCEILIPVIMVFFLLYIRVLVDVDNISEKSYIDNANLLEAVPTIDNFTYNFVSHLDPNNSLNLTIFDLLYKNHTFKNCYRYPKGGKIALSPDNIITREIANNFNKFPVPIPISFFKDDSEIDNYITNDQYGSDAKPYLCLGVSVSMPPDETSYDYTYKLRFNVSGGDQEIFSTIFSPKTIAFVKESNELTDKYVNTGYLTLQTWIDNIILKTYIKNATFTPQVASVRVEAYKKDNIGIYLQGQAKVFLVLPLILPYLKMIFRLLYEKEKKIREGMKMMGMSDFSFYLSWILTYLIIYTLICVINASILVLGFFTYSNWFLVFLMLWIFCIVLIFQSLFVSVFFTRVKAGIIGGIVFFFLLYMINVIIAANGDVTYETKKNSSLSSHAAVSFASDSLLILQTREKGLTFSTLNIDVNNYNFAIFFGFEFLNIIIFAFLSLYLDQVFPNEFGKKRSPLFFLDCFFKKKNKNVNELKQPMLENEGDADDSIEVKEITEAVNNNFIQQEKNNEALLIKNMSKTYSNGKKAVIQLNLNMYKGQIFVLLGHNGAGKTTTLSILTGLLDATSGSASIFGLDIGSEMEVIRKKMGVCPQHDILFDTLTVQEHLELFATFKGMDAKDIPQEVSKIIDDIDLKEKKDYISKNLSGGQKRRLSVGIAFIGNSNIILLDEPTSGMDTSARRYIWEMLKNYKNERIVILTTHFMDEADFLGDRIGIMGDGILKCCGSSVYLKNKFGVGYNLTVVRSSSQPSSEIKDLVLSIIPDAKCLSEVSAEISFQLPLSNLPKFKELFSVLDQNLNKLGIATYGISITTLEEVFLRVAEGTTDVTLQENLRESKKHEVINLEEQNEFDLNSVKVKNGFSLFFIHFWAIFIKRLQYFKRDKKGLCCEILLPAIIIIIGLCLTFIKFVTDAPTTYFEPNILDSPRNIPAQEIYKNFFNEMNFGKGNFDFYLGNADRLDTFDNFVFQSRFIDENGVYGAYFFDSYNQIEQPANTTTKTIYTLLYNSTTPFSLPILLNQMNQAIIRNLTQKPITIKIIDSPFPLTKKLASLSDTANGFIAIFVFSVAMSFVPASLIVYIVKEKENKVKHQHLVSGMGLGAYWLSNYFVDLIKLSFSVLFSIFMCKAFNIKGLIEPNSSWGAVWLLFIFFGTSTISFTYLVSFLFKDYGNAQTFNFVFFFLMSVLGSLLIFVLKLIPSSRGVAKIIQYLLRIFPPFSLGLGILNISNRELFSIIESYPEPKDAFDSDIALWDILFMLIFSFVYFILIFVVEKVITIPKVLQIFSKENSVPYEPINYDGDVLNEMEVINHTSPKDYTVYVKDLRKVYQLNQNQFKVAVTKTSFGIKNGDCFALLGVNGAGKTTTFKMLCGEIPPTSGTAYIAGYEITDELELARENIGYCPQFDALLENLTAKEHLFLYAAIKGIPKNLRAQLVERNLQELNLKKYENVCAGTYSGGNKRKLSVALALLGNPPIVFLDEPSTGMDPKARRFMWDVINRISTLRKKSSIILTTHSMEEAEALATKISIMVNGTFKCLGSVQHIKSKFGKGYEIEIKTMLPDASRIEELRKQAGVERGKKVVLGELKEILDKLGKGYLVDRFADGKTAANIAMELKKISGLAIEVLVEYIETEDYGDGIIHSLSQQFKEVSLIEHYQSFYRFKLNSAVSIGNLFGWFEDNKDNLNISQYSIKQATIEQIFNMFAKDQIEDEQENENKNEDPEVQQLVLKRRQSSLAIMEGEGSLYRSNRSNKSFAKRQEEEFKEDIKNNKKEE